jgi:predicted PurR-regulated permease PerM
MNLSKNVLLGLVVVLLLLSLLLVLPFLQYVLGALFLSYILYPPYLRLEEHTSPMIAAFTLVMLSITGFVAPFVVLLATVLDNADRVLQNLDPNASPVEEIESWIMEATGREVDLVDEFVSFSQEIGTIAFERSTEAFSTITYHLLGVALALFLVYYLLKDGDDLIDWLHQAVPLPMDIQRELFAELDAVMRGVLFGHVFVAIVQGIVAGIGLFVTDVPNAAFWTAIMIFLAMVPLIGTIPVWGGAVIYLYLTGQPVSAAGLFAYSVVIVGLTDDYLRPFAVDRYAKLNPAVVLLGILGGVYALGFIGLFLGPVILGASKATLRVFSEHSHRLDNGDAR